MLSPMKKLLAIIVLGLFLTGCVAIGNQNLEIENKIRMMIKEIMKKLLAIIVLGLLLSGNAYTKEELWKCEKNLVTLI